METRGRNAPGEILSGSCFGHSRILLLNRLALLLPEVEPRPETVDLGESALEAVTLGLLDPPLQGECFEVAACRIRCGKGLLAPHNFGLKERRLIQQVVAVNVVSSDFHGDKVVVSLDQSLRDCPLVYPEKPKGCPGGAVTDELAVHGQSVKR
jgi:hypothetical protein